MTTTHEHPMRKVCETQVRHVQLGQGYLKVYTTVRDGRVVSEMFTLQSLADCMGWGKGAMEQRYARGHLHLLKHDIPTGQSRPVRGFPLADLEDVIRVMVDPKARAVRRGNDIMAASTQRVADKGALTFETHGGKRYITIPTLARMYGRSTTAIRNRLAKAGLLRKATNLSYGQAGRPRRGFPEEMYKDLVAAIEDGAQFMNEAQLAYNRVMQSPTHPGAQQEITDEEAERQWYAAMKEAGIQLPAGNPEPARPSRPSPFDGVDFDALLKPTGERQPVDPFAQINALAKPSAVAQASNPATTPPLQVWIDKLRDPIADCRIWDVDIIKDQMRAAGLSEDDIMDAEYAAERPAPAGSGPDQSAGAAS